jgi:NAD(P)-dependent dehydrogenase (short-subunit alcohol dehydrogenase family)
MNILIIGASRGIGLEFVRQYVAAGIEAVGTARDDEGMQRIADAGGDALAFDALTDDPQILTDTVGSSLNLAIYNAGVYGPQTAGTEAVTQADFDRVMHTNVWAAMQVIPALAPALERGKGKLVTLSSLMGSLGERVSTTSWLYRASKSAINSVLLDTAHTLGPRGVTCLSVHPGWVRTDMGGPNADLSVEQSVTGLRKVIEAAKARDNGGFYAYDGRKIAW